MSSGEALIVGTGPDVEDEIEIARKHMPDALVIGVNYGAWVIEPDILFSNHAKELKAMARKLERDTGWTPELHTTPLPKDREHTDGLKCWPDAYRTLIGSGICAAFMAKLMGCTGAVLVGCPKTRKYWLGRRHICLPDHAAKEVAWGEGQIPVRDRALKNACKELRGFATSTSGKTRQFLGAPHFMPEPLFD